MHLLVENLDSSNSNPPTSGVQVFQDIPTTPRALPPPPPPPTAASSGSADQALSGGPTSSLHISNKGSHQASSSTAARNLFSSSQTSRPSLSKRASLTVQTIDGGTSAANIIGDGSKSLVQQETKVSKVAKVNDCYLHRSQKNHYFLLPSLKTQLTFWVKESLFIYFPQKRSQPQITKASKKTNMGDVPTEQQFNKNWRNFNAVMRQQNITYKMRRSKG